MKHILNNISEEEKNAIREQHAGGMKLNTEKFKQLIETKQGDVKPLVSEESLINENDLIRLVNKVIKEQTATSRQVPLLPKESKEEAQRRFFNQMVGVLKPMIGSKTQFFRFSNNTRQDIKENKKQTLVFRKFLPAESWIQEYTGYMSIGLMFQTDWYKPGSTTPIPCYTRVSLPVSTDNSKPGVFKWEYPQVYVTLDGFDNLSEKFQSNGNLFSSGPSANDDMRAANLKIDANAVMNLLKQYDASLRPQKFK